MYLPGTDPNSIDDVDLMGVVLAPEECYLGLQTWGSRGTKEYKEQQYDCVFYEIRKMIALLLQGNPNVIGMLWLRPEHYLHLEPSGRKLIENRALFVGKHLYEAFAGYAEAQLEKMETRDPAELRRYLAIDRVMKARGIHPNHKRTVVLSEASDRDDEQLADWSDEALRRHWASYHKKGENIGYLGEKRKRLVLEHGYDAKNAAHCVRLLRMCKEFLDTGEMRVFRDRDAEELLAIKRGQWTLSAVKEHARDLFAEAEKARDRSALQAGPDREGAERLLIEIVREHLVKSGPGPGL
jgi:predicted nucleotidyltransferase